MGEEGKHCSESQVREKYFLLRSMAMNQDGERVDYLKGIFMPVFLRAPHPPPFFARKEEIGLKKGDETRAHFSHLHKL